MVVRYLQNLRKIIYKLDWLSPSEEVLEGVKWHTLKTQYITTVLVLTYKLPPPTPLKPKAFQISQLPKLATTNHYMILAKPTLTTSTPSQSRKVKVRDLRNSAWRTSVR